ncbi:MAG: helix-turn-helix domain-containing protein [Magnetococcus sp. YQC-5]
MNLMTTKEAAEYLQLSPGTLTNWRMRKFGPKYVKNGGSVRYTQSAIAEWIQSRTVDPNIKQEPQSIKPRSPSRAEKLRETLNLPRVPRGRRRSRGCSENLDKSS